MMQKLLPGLLLCTLLVMSLAVQANSDRHAISEATDAAVLKVVLNDQQPPLAYAGSIEHEANGFLVDLWRAFGEAEDIDVEFIFQSHEQALALVAQGEADVYGGVTAGLTNSLATGPTLAEYKYYLWLHQSVPLFPTPDQATAWVIGVVADSPDQRWLELHYPNLRLRTYDNVHALFDAALNNQIRVFLFNEYLDPRFANVSQLMRQYPIYRRVEAGENRITVALQPAREDLLDRLSRLPLMETEALKKGMVARDLKDDSVLRLSAPDDAWPLSATNNEGEPEGLLIDLWRAWSEVTDIPIQFVPMNNRLGYLNVKDGESDVMLAATEMGMDEFGLTSVIEYYNTPLLVYADPEQTSAERLSELADSVTLGMVASHQRQRDILQQLAPQISILPFNSLQDVEEAILERQIQGFVGPALITARKRQSSSVIDNLRTFATPQLPLPVYVATMGDAALAERIEDGFAMIPWQQKVRIEERWVGDENLQYYPYLPRRVVLQSGERQWLEGLGALRVGLPADSAPIIMQDEQGRVVGLDSDIMRLIEQRTPLLIDWKPCGDWQRCLDALRDREIDVLPFLSDTEERREYVNFSDVYWETPWAIASRENAALSVDSLSELSGYRIAMVASYSLMAQLKQVEDIDVVAVDTPEEGLTVVLEGAADGYIDSLPLLIERIREQRTGNIAISLLRDEPGDQVTFGVRSDWPQLVPVLNRAIETITEAERSAINERWFDYQFDEGISAEQVRKWSLRAGIAVFFVILVFLVWNSRLRREIERRKEVEEKIKYLAKHDDLTQLPNRSLLTDRLQQAVHLHHRHKLRFAVMFLDLDGFKEVNDREGHDAGDRLLVEIAQRLQGALRKNDTVSRFGGDEFVVVLTELDDVEQALAVAGKLIAEVTEPYDLDGVTAEVTVSIGIAMYPDDADQADVLLRLADKAMYQVKREGKNDVQLAASMTPER
ncbi:hypothetical protein CWE09_06435 [Aliidiomarina minuta]|uniref:GGDEF domain-containing protein n=1 Tax=Aliidiomarina minuta TaxID=880057 RepID=A0A432W891_9GAMM|nr:transporter substrate-binding domain-containing protein [Aliidiomarina minuta]RUO26343.1 hypothetical protein CWE09_06435 [Aliidiomarina minuta]